MSKEVIKITVAYILCIVMPLVIFGIGWLFKPTNHNDLQIYGIILMLVSFLVFFCLFGYAVIKSYNMQEKSSSNSTDNKTKGEQ